MVSQSTIKKKVNHILESMGITEPKDIDVKKIAENLGLKVIEHDLGENVSGVLYVEKGKGKIGYNPGHGSQRNRFTIAHELGHFILHRLSKELFIDKQSYKPIFRDERSSLGEHTEEVEANSFAAALLMPEDMLRSKIKEYDLDLWDDEDTAMIKLAKEFNVSQTAMAFRISNLNLY